MTARLIGRKTSSNVQKVMWTAAELGLTYTQEERGGAFGGLDTAEFGALNPLRLVPVWIDETVTLAESHAIMRYLSEQHGGIGPSDPARRAIADQWTEIAQTRFNPAVTAIFWQAFRTPPRDQDAARIAAAVEQLANASAIFEARLGEVPYLAGDAFSLADIAAGTMMHRYWTLPFARPERPNLLAWTDRLRDRAPFRDIVETSYESLRGV